MCVLPLEALTESDLLYTAARVHVALSLRVERMPLHLTAWLGQGRILERQILRRDQHCAIINSASPKFYMDIYFKK